MILKRKFFNRPTLKVAQDFLGKFIVRKIGKKKIVLMITEAEAYDGHEDKASHAHKGKTSRNEPMFGEAGRWYVYLVYGMHEMLNIVTGPKNYPAAILIRGAHLLSTDYLPLTNLDGPGKLTRFLKINRSAGRRINGKSATEATGLWLEDRGVKIKKSQIKRTPRVGVAYAGPIWSKKHYRFVLK